MPIIYTPPNTGGGGAGDGNSGGTVTSVAVTGASPLVVSGGPITNTGTITLSIPTYANKAAYSPNTTPWSPLQASGCLFYLNHWNGKLMWNEVTSAGTVCKNPAIPNFSGKNLVGQIYDEANGIRAFTSSASARPQLNRDSTKNSYLSFNGAQGLLVENTRLLFANMYSSGTINLGNWTLGVMCRPSASGTYQAIFDQINTTTANTGFGLFYDGSSNNNQIRLQITGTPGISSEPKLASVPPGQWLTIIASGNGVNGYLSVNGSGGTPVSMVGYSAGNIGYSATVSGVPKASSLDTYIGQSAAGNKFFTGDIAHLFFANTNWGNQPQDVAQWMALDPTFGFYPTNGLKYNGMYNSSSLQNLNAATGVRTEWIDPRTLVGLTDFCDCTDTSVMYTALSGTTLPVVSPNTTHPAVSGDRVAYIANKAVNDILIPRMSYNNANAQCPVWRPNVINGVGGVYFTGNSPSIPDANENTLAFYPWTPGPKTFFLAFMEQSARLGSHVISNGVSSQPYTAFGSPTHTSADRRLAVVNHSSNGQSITENLHGVSQSGINIVEVVQDGASASILLNGYWIYTDGATASGSNANFGEYVPAHMGRPAITGWNMNGYIFYRICAQGALDGETRRRVRGWIANQLGVASSGYINLSY